LGKVERVRPDKVARRSRTSKWLAHANMMARSLSAGRAIFNGPLGSFTPKMLPASVRYDRIDFAPPIAMTL